MTPPAHRHTAAHTGGQRHGPRATARRNDTDTSDTSKDGQRHGHRDRRRRTQGTQGPAPHTSGDGPQAAAECYPLTRQAHKAQKRAATGHTRTTADQWTSGRPKGRQRPRKRPPRPRTDTSHGPTASTADGHQRQGPPASTPASHTDGRHHGGRPRRRPVLAATSTASHTDTATDGGPHGPTTGGQYKPVFGEYGVSIAYTKVLVSGNATNTPASRAEVGEVIAAEVGPRSRGASSFEFVRREHCPRST